MSFDHLYEFDKVSLNRLLIKLKLALSTHMKHMNRVEQFLSYKVLIHFSFDLSYKMECLLYHSGAMCSSASFFPRCLFWWLSAQSSSLETASSSLKPQKPEAPTNCLIQKHFHLCSYRLRWNKQILVD